MPGMDNPVPPPGGSGTALPAWDLSLRGALAMFARNRDVYWKTWKTNFLPPLLEPLLYLLSIGYGVGALVETVGGVSYARFVAPAILAITMMQAAFFETTYNSFVRMWFQKTWEAVTATPLSLDDVVAGELVWAAAKSAINTALMGLVVCAFGLLPWIFLPVAVALAFVVGLTFAGLGMMFTAKVPGIDAFSFAIYLFVTPMMLFSGTFFPLDALPPAAQAVAHALPLTHAVLLLRVLTQDAAMPWWSLAYTVAAALVFPALAMRMMRRRLAA